MNEAKKGENVRYIEESDQVRISSKDDICKCGHERKRHRNQKEMCRVCFCSEFRKKKASDVEKPLGDFCIIVYRCATRINADGFLRGQRTRENAKYHNEQLLLVLDPKAKDGLVWLIVSGACKC